MAVIAGCDGFFSGRHQLPVNQFIIYKHIPTVTTQRNNLFFGCCVNSRPRFCFFRDYLNQHRSFFEHLSLGVLSVKKQKKTYTLYKKLKNKKNFDINSASTVNIFCFTCLPFYFSLIHQQHILSHKISHIFLQLSEHWHFL